MRIYSQMRLGVTPEINAISSILVGIVVVGLTIAALIQGRYACLPPSR